MGRTIALRTGSLIGFAMIAAAFGVEQNAAELVFELKEASRFELPEEARYSPFGQFLTLAETTPAAVKTWPAFQSRRPIRGSVPFDVVYGEADSGIEYHFAFDESRGTGKGYDRLYLDLNRDLDLTNDAPLLPRKRTPAWAPVINDGTARVTYFENVSIPFDFGPAGKRPVEILPRLIITREGRREMDFLTTKVRRGQIEIAGRPYEAVLGHERHVGGRFDRPFVALYLIPKRGRDPRSRSFELSQDHLGAIRPIGNTNYCFSATPTGDRLIVRPYDGEFGTFEIGPGGRDIRTMAMSGSLRSRDTSVIVGGEIGDDGRPAKARRCRLPVGDYSPFHLTIDFGRLQVMASENLFGDGRRFDPWESPKVHGITIRRERPFVLDFSNKPELLFASPPKGHRVKAGETLEVTPVLIDPKLNIMIRNLRATTLRSGEGSSLLDPKVRIARLDGTQVAEPFKPFG